MCVSEDPRIEAPGGQRPPDKEPDDLDGLSFEQALDRVEGLIEQIESGEIGLEQSIEAYERGARLIGRCRAALARAEQRVRTLDAELLESDRKGADQGRDETDSGGDEPAPGSGVGD